MLFGRKHAGSPLARLAQRDARHVWHSDQEPVYHHSRHSFRYTGCDSIVFMAGSEEEAEGQRERGGMGTGCVREAGSGWA